jgi:hypothetical protein
VALNFDAVEIMLIAESRDAESVGVEICPQIQRAICDENLSRLSHPTAIPSRSRTLYGVL